MSGTESACGLRVCCVVVSPCGTWLQKQTRRGASFFPTCVYAVLLEAVGGAHGNEGSIVFKKKSVPRTQKTSVSGCGVQVFLTFFVGKVICSCVSLKVYSSDTGITLFAVGEN